MSRPETKVKISIRLPPTLDANKAAEDVKRILEANPPYEAHVEFNVMSSNGGWAMTEFKPEFEEVVQKAAKGSFGEDCELMSLSMGGSIPLVGMMNAKFPDAQFMVTGVLGPGSNAHCPDESVDIAFLGKVMNTLVEVIGEGSRVL